MTHPSADDQIPDPEEDFEGFVGGLAEQVIKRIETVPEHLRPTYFILQSAARLHRYLQMDNPITYIQEHEKRILQRRVAELPVYCADYVPPPPEDDQDG